MRLPMKQKLLLILAIGMACLPGLVSAPEEIPGLRYEQRKAAGPQSIHILYVDPVRLHIMAVRALDGGGSSTVFYRDKVVNSPSDPAKDRPVSDVIVIIQ